MSLGKYIAHAKAAGRTASGLGALGALKAGAWLEEHPTISHALKEVGKGAAIGGATDLAIRGGSKLDAMLPGSEMPDSTREAVLRAGGDPDDYEDVGRSHPFSGAALGAGTAAAFKPSGSSLAKYLAIGGGLGGLLGASITSHKRKRKHEED